MPDIRLNDVNDEAQLRKFGNVLWEGLRPVRETMWRDRDEGSRHLFNWDLHRFRDLLAEHGDPTKVTWLRLVPTCGGVFVEIRQPGPNRSPQLIWTIDGIQLIGGRE